MCPHRQPHRQPGQQHASQNQSLRQVQHGPVSPPAIVQGISNSSVHRTSCAPSIARPLRNGWEEHRGQSHPPALFILRCSVLKGNLSILADLPQSRKAALFGKQSALLQRQLSKALYQGMTCRGPRRQVFVAGVAWVVPIRPIK
jgi:hypothetical protein